MNGLFTKLITKLIEKPLAKLKRWIDEQNAEADAAREADTEANAQKSAEEAVDAVDFSLLKFRWGGFRGDGAKLNASARIINLCVRSGKLSYKWISGGCEDLGAHGRDDASVCLACLFCLIHGEWVGGKFEWISTSRTSRDLGNISSGYNGWDSQAVDKADKFAFVIISRDGRRRTNVIACGK